MPEGLEIDRDPKSKLNGLISMYAEQVLVCTGRDDWPSRIEDDDPEDGENVTGRKGKKVKKSSKEPKYNFTRHLKEIFGRDGPFGPNRQADKAEPNRLPVSILNSSFSPSVDFDHPEPLYKATTSAYLLPSFTYVPYLSPHPDRDALAFASNFFGPPDRKPRFGMDDYNRPVRDVVILICGHGGRDARCGIMGPLLREQFEKTLPTKGIHVLHGPPAGEGEDTTIGMTSRVGLISHIGGHKFAGNVIIYIPPRYRKNALAGHGIWYGRVEPKHVEGIVEETILKGNVIEDMFRGGITPDRKILRL